MPDKDQFTFDDEFPEHNPDAHGSSSEDGARDDGFPETDFNASLPEDRPSTVEPRQDEPGSGVQGESNSRTRILLMILLLMVVGAAGAYYFMDLGETNSVSTVVMPAQPGTKPVAPPTQPAPVAAAPSQDGNAAKNVTVAVPPPPPRPEETARSQAGAEVQQAGQAAAEQPPGTAKPAEQAAEAAVATKEEARQPELVPAAVASQVEDGAYILDAGSYLLESNRKKLVEKIKQLGYEPSVTPLEATLNMTRLRLGTYRRDEVQDALAFARTIEPASYSAPAGDGYVIYAGTFLKRDNVDKLSVRFAEEGIKVHPEPVQVVRTLNRVRFGHFATREDALAASREVAAAGLKAEVVKVK